jgi:hypothetical protein
MLRLFNLKEKNEKMKEKNEKKKEKSKIILKNYRKPKTLKKNLAQRANPLVTACSCPCADPWIRAASG